MTTDTEVKTATRRKTQKVSFPLKHNTSRPPFGESYAPSFHKT